MRILSLIISVSAYCTREDCMPSADEWQKLNTTVGGRLEIPEQPIWACMNPQNWTSHEVPVSDACAYQWGQSHANPFYNQVQAGGYQTIGWVNQFNTTVSRYAVRALTAEDIQAAITFAAEHNIRPVIKGAGHDYLGRSQGPEMSLLIWTYWMKNITWDGDLMTVEAGVIWEDAYAAAIAKNRAVVGGGCPTVGAAGGFPMGGGMSDDVGKILGNGPENMVECKVVLANSTLVTANNETNSDLFWALRGGGGGTFGVVTEMTYQTHPLDLFADDKFWTFDYRGACDSTAVRKVLKAQSDLLNTVDQKKWGGIFKSQGGWDNNGTLVPEGADWTVVHLYLTIANTSEADVRAQLTPFYDFLVSENNTCFWSNNLDLSKREGFPYKLSGSNDDFTAEGPAFTPEIIDYVRNRKTNPSNDGEVNTYWGYYVSHYFNASEYANTTQLADKFGQMVELGVPGVTMSLGKGMAVWDADKQEVARIVHQDTSIRPQAYDAGGLFIVTLNMENPTPAAANLDIANLDTNFTKPFLESFSTGGCANVDALKESCQSNNLDTAEGALSCYIDFIECFSLMSSMAPAVFNKLEELFPGMGSYPNESEYTLDAWKEQFWGDSYERLLEIKQKYDPNLLFTCHHCIGSDLVPDHQMSSAYSATFLLIPLLAFM